MQLYIGRNHTQMIVDLSAITLNWQQLMFWRTENIHFDLNVMKIIKFKLYWNCIRSLRTSRNLFIHQISCSDILFNSNFGVPLHVSVK